MSEQGTTKKKGIDWFVILYFGSPVVLLLIFGFIGFVKFMAWWRVAFGDCSP